MATSPTNRRITCNEQCHQPIDDDTRRDIDESIRELLERDDPTGVLLYMAMFSSTGLQAAAAAAVHKHSHLIISRPPW